MVISENQLERIKVQKVNDAARMYDVILQGVKNKFDLIQSGNREQVQTLTELHYDSQAFIENLFDFNQKQQEVIDYLLN